MKLNDIFETTTVEDAIDDVYNYTNFADEPVRDFNQSVNILMRDSSNVYVGEMFRMLFLDASAVVQLTFDKIPSLIRSDKGFQSWSKDEEGVITALQLHTPTPTIYALHKHSVGVLLKQSGRALDTEALLHRERGSEHVCNTEEKELLATLQGKPTIIKLWFNNKTYQLNQYNLMLSKIRRTLAS